MNGILYIDHLVDHESLYKITYAPDDEEGEDEDIEDDGREDEVDESEIPASPVTAETSASAVED